MFNFSEDLKPELKSERKPKNEPIIELLSEQALNKSCTSSDTSTEQAVVPSINYINNTNSSNKKNIANLNEQAKKNEELNNEKLKEEKSSAKKEEKEMPDDKLERKTNALHPAFADYNAEQAETSRQKSSAKKEKNVDDFVIPSDPETSVEVSPLKKATPTIEEIKSYFQANNFPELEAQKFFNYFSSVGWLVGGKIPMIDWQAAAQNWMINAPKFISNTEQPNRPKQLNTSTDKNYAEPL
jgi:hypothetical protein